MKQTFLSIGECMVEMAPTANGDYHLGFAGDTLNTAWYARQTLGPDWDVAYFTAVGQDAVSERMTDFIRDAGIRTGLIRELPDHTVGLYLIQLDNGERTCLFAPVHLRSSLVGVADGPNARCQVPGISAAAGRLRCSSC